MTGRHGSASSSDGEDYIFVGTALDEEESSHRGQHHKDLKDPAGTRSLPLWKQEVTDEQGRRRFHGAFTGGYSAGYFNTVGSKEGFTPGAFRSSRSDRNAAAVSQNVEDFLDEDELQERNKVQVETTKSYDTFGFTSTEQLHKAAFQGSSERPQIIPGGIVKELVEAVSDSWGVNLLKKMGWRQGRGIGVAGASADPSSSGSKWGTVAGVGTDNTPIFTMKPKRDRYGMCFDPYKGSEEFRRARGSGAPADSFAMQQKRKRGVAFGTGVLEEFETYGEEDDYVTEIDSRADAYQEIASDDENDDGPLGHSRSGQKYLGRGKDPALQIGTAEHSRRSHSALIRGFVAAIAASQASKHHAPPRVPQGFEGRHRFRGSAPGASSSGMPPAAPAPVQDAVAAPEEKELKRAADTLAAFVAKNGKQFEDLARQRQAGDSKFSFLRGGEGSEYYAWRLKCLAPPAPDSKAAAPLLPPPPPPPPMNPEERSKILGEERLRPSTTSVPAAPSAAPKAAQAAAPAAVLPRRGHQDPTRPADSATSSVHATLAASFANRFAASGSVQLPPAVEGGLTKKGSSGLLGQDAEPADEPRGEEELPVVRQPPEDWWPEPLLCKRFGVPDPHKGKERPTHGGTGSRFMNDHLLLPLPPPPPPPPDETLPSEKSLESAVSGGAGSLMDGVDAGQLADAFLSSLMGGGAADSSPDKDASGQEGRTGGGGGVAAGVGEVAPVAGGQEGPAVAMHAAPDAAEAVVSTGRPLDLFKAIFEDDDDEEEEDEEDDNAGDQQKGVTSAADEPGAFPKGAGAEAGDAGPGPGSLNTLGGALLRAKQIAAEMSDAQQMRLPGPPPPPAQTPGSGLGSASQQAHVYRPQGPAGGGAGGGSAMAQRPPERPSASDKPPSGATSSEVLRILDALKGAKKSSKHKKEKKHKSGKESSGSKRKSSDKSRSSKDHGKKHSSSKSKKRKADEKHNKEKSSRSSSGRKSTKKARRSSPSPGSRGSGSSSGSSSDSE